MNCCKDSAKMGVAHGERVGGDWNTTLEPCSRRIVREARNVMVSEQGSGGQWRKVGGSGTEWARHSHI